MSENLEQAMQEYRAIRDWLQGKKPAPRGRTWRRTLVTAMSLPLPAQTQDVVYRKSAGWGMVLSSLPPGLPIILHAALGGALIAVAPHVAESVMGTGMVAHDALATSLLTLMHSVQTLAGWFAGGVMAFGGCCVLVNGR